MVLIVCGGANRVWCVNSVWWYVLTGCGGVNRVRWCYHGGANRVRCVKMMVCVNRAVWCVNRQCLGPGRGGRGVRGVMLTGCGVLRGWCVLTGWCVLRGWCVLTGRCVLRGWCDVLTGWCGVLTGSVWGQDERGEECEG